MITSDSLTIQGVPRSPILVTEPVRRSPVWMRRRKLKRWRCAEPGISQQQYHVLTTRPASVGTIMVMNTTPRGDLNEKRDAIDMRDGRKRSPVWRNAHFALAIR